MTMFLRLADAADSPLLLDALYEAFNWRGDELFTREQLLADPHIGHYVDGWQRDTDFGVVAMGDNGSPLGAAWCRFFDEADAGYGFVANGVPELTMAVFAQYRGQGIGTKLLDAILDVARERGYAAVSLSVEDDNGARRLYEQAGFVPVGRNGGSDTMMASLANAPAAASL
jgi:ribosomal protein S18 acetylase RimI-like enzyme